MAFAVCIPLRPAALTSFSGSQVVSSAKRQRSMPKQREYALVCTVLRETSPFVSTLYWDWKGFGRVRYLSAGADGGSSHISTGRDHRVKDEKKAPTILFVPGFGICASDFLANMPALAAAGFRVFAIDKLGLGESFPASQAVAKSITVELWRDQIISFIEEVLDGGPVFLAGNSLGGLLCASVSAVRSHLVRGAILFNPAPFWVVLPRWTPKLLRWAFRALLQTFWNRLTNAAVIQETLSLVYARPDNIPPTLVDDILAPTRYEHAKDVFESVLSSPMLDNGFDESIKLAFAQRKIPLAIIYGREDPWVVPLFGLRVKGMVPDCTYYELSPCGHCAHAEAPQAVNAIVESWVVSISKGEKPMVLGEPGRPAILGDVKVYTRDGSPRNVFERFASAKNYSLVFILAYLSTFMTVMRDSSLE